MRFVKLESALARPSVRSSVDHEKESTIYAMSDPIDNRIRYVGKTNGPLILRLHEHQCKPVNAAMALWLLRMKISDRIPVMTILEIAQRDRWQYAERFWIRWLRSRGDLLNIDAGGIMRDKNGALLSGPGRKKFSARNQANRERLAIAKKSGPVRRFSPEEIAEMNAKLMHR